MWARLFIVLLLFTAAFGSLSANPGAGAVRIVGSLDGGRDKVELSGVHVAINGHRAVVEGTRFSATVPRARYYYVEVEGAAVFATMQTFGNR